MIHKIPGEISPKYRYLDERKEVKNLTLSRMPVMNAKKIYLDERKIPKNAMQPEKRDEKTRESLPNSPEFPDFPEIPPPGSHHYNHI